MMMRTGGTVKTSVGMSCRRSWPFGRVGWRRYGRPWRRWKPRRRWRPNGPRPKVVSIRGCPRTRPSATSPMPSRASCRQRREGLPAGVQLPGGGGQRSPGDRGGAGHQPDYGQATGGGDAAGDHRQRRCSPQGSIRRCWLLLGTGSRRAFCSGRGSVRRAGKDPHGHKPPPAPRGRIPKDLSPRDRMRRKLQTKRGRQRYALRMGTVEPVFGQIKQGRGFRQFLLRGLEQVDGEWSLICTGHNCSNCSASGSICTGKHESMGPPNASGTLPR